MILTALMTIGGGAVAGCLFMRCYGEEAIAKSGWLSEIWARSVALGATALWTTWVTLTLALPHQFIWCYLSAEPAWDVLWAPCTVYWHWTLAIRAYLGLFRLGLLKRGESAEKMLKTAETLTKEQAEVSGVAELVAFTRKNGRFFLGYYPCLPRLDSLF